MAQPTVRVRVGFTANEFTLDDAIRGLLGTGELGGAVSLSDVTSDVQSITINRGRSKDLESFFTGSCTVRLLNNTRKYENTNTSSPFSPGIEPLIAIHIDATTDGGSSYEDLFVGFVTDINLTYPDKSNSFADFVASDAFMKIANTEIVNQSFSSTTSGAMIEAVLDNTDVKFSAGDRDIETGLSTMQAFSDLSGNTLSILQQIEQSENGLLFISKSGNLTFKSRHTTFPSSSVATFSDDGSDVPYISVDYVNDDNEIYNVINLTRNGGTTQTAEDLASQGKYLVRTLSRDSLFNNTDTEVLDASNFLLSKFKDALIRFDNLIVDVKEATTSNQNTILAREVGDIVQVELTPTGSGSPAQIQTLEIIDSISYSITPDIFTCTYMLSNADVQAFFRLNNTLFGVLDTDKLGY
tara:strand:- start:9850 stop:11082 length:1233 start_codon:yes stop_codon:yes gene_type:complete